MGDNNETCLRGSVWPSFENQLKSDYQVNVLTFFSKMRPTMRSVLEEVSGLVLKIDPIRLVNHVNVLTFFSKMRPTTHSSSFRATRLTICVD